MRRVASSRSSTSREMWLIEPGTHVDRRTLRWWELWGTVRWGGMCLGMGGTFRLGLTNSIEMGMIGRRVVENESDIVELLDELMEDR